MWYLVIFFVETSLTYTDYDNSRDVFPSVDIKGGVAIGYRDRNNILGPIEVFTANDFMTRILKKVTKKAESYLNEIWVSNTSYCYTKDFFTDNPAFKSRVSGGSSRYLSSSVFDKFPECFFDEKPADGEEYAEIIGRQNNSRVIKWFRTKYFNPPKNFGKYKVFLASSSGSGKIGEAFADPVLGAPNIGATETFFSLGNFNNEIEASNLLKYLKTKFARVMLSTSKVTQAMKSEKVWVNVPSFKFNSEDDIDWSKPIPQIDEMLFSIFGLDEAEARYVREVAAPMD